MISKTNYPKSNDHKVNQFIDDIAQISIVKYEILQEVRLLFFSTYPDVSERMMYGGIMFTLEEDFAGIFVYKQHVSLEFGNGYQMEDPHHLLEGTGKYRRHIKIKLLSDIVKKDVHSFINQAA